MPPNFEDSINETVDLNGGKKKANSNLKKREIKKEKPSGEILLDRVLPKNSPITYGLLKQSIPAHCFQQSSLYSLFETLKDLIEIGFYMFVMYYIDRSFDGPFMGEIRNSIGEKLGSTFASLLILILRTVSLILYGAICGTTMTGVWVIAHECGHGAFSPSQTLNDIVGFILHTSLSAPYFSWQHSHASHHMHTNDLEKDEVFVPKVKGNKTKSDSILSNLFAHVQVIAMLIIGWPVYLAINAGGRLGGEILSHYSPSSSLFGEKGITSHSKLITLRIKVFLSNLGLLGWWAFLYYLGVYVFQDLGLVLRIYLPPLLVTNAFLVSITYLQHTHEELPHYDHSDWTWLRGALATVDRSTGSRYIDKKLHFIHTTHVLHHVFPKIPFYHAEEATKALIPVLGKYYHQDPENFFIAFWKTAHKCIYLEDSKGIFFWLTEAQ